MPTRSPSFSGSTSALELIPIIQVLSGRIEAVNVDDVCFESDSSTDGDDLDNNLFLTLLVKGEGGQLFEATGLAWEVPDLIQGTPKRSEMWAKYCVEIMKSIVVNSKPRKAIRDATLAMGTILLRCGEV